MSTLMRIKEENLEGGKKTWKFYSSGEKWELLATTKVKMNAVEKSEQEYIDISSIKRVTRKILKVSRKINKNQSQETSQDSTQDF